MTRTQEHLNLRPQLTQTGRTSGIGGEHQSAPVPIKLTTAVLLPFLDGAAWLSEACAPWTCDTYLHAQVREMDLSMPADNARRVLCDLSALLATAEGVT